MGKLINIIKALFVLFMSQLLTSTVVIPNDEGDRSNDSFGRDDLLE